MTILKSANLNPKFIEKIRHVMGSYYGKKDIDLSSFFKDVFEPMMQALLMSWIKIYGKPVLTTTFLGSAKSEASLGYHAFPSTEQAATVLAKLVEYQEFLDRKSKT